MKKLISEKEVKEILGGSQKLICVDSDTILTASAKDLAESGGIKVEYGDCNKCSSSGVCSAGNATPVSTPSSANSSGIDSEYIYNALKVLAEKGLLDTVMNSLGSSIGGNDDQKPYKYEKDGSGLKVVNGKTVELDYLDTGNANNKTYYQEVVCSKESAVMNAGFLEIENCNFDWTVGCDEMYYVIEGPLWITVGGKRYTANAGDVVNLPVGYDIQIGAPGKAKMFYGIKAA